ncbi:MAG: hypothetical protein IJ087_10725 [Eggerthellaceae bacterium]|nr:hypothetical protein [Eggerthellaceae bacterium]
MATVRQIAEACGVTKPTIFKIMREIDPTGEHQSQVGNRVDLDAFLASAVADEAIRRKSKGSPRAAQEAVVEAVEEAQDSFERHDVEVAALRQRIADLEEHSERLLAEKEARIADLKEQVERLTAEVAGERAAHESTRRELAMARELQGFKWPWTRREIIARYAALPPASE